MWCTKLRCIMYHHFGAYSALLIVFVEFNLKTTIRSLFIAAPPRGLEGSFYSVRETLHVVTKNKVGADNIFFFFLLDHTLKNCL